MNKNRIIVAIFAVSLLFGRAVSAQEQTQHEVQRSLGSSYDKKEHISRLKKEWQEFWEALRCLRQKGFRGCTPAQKKRIIAAGITTLATILGLSYLGYRIFEPLRCCQTMMVM